MGDIISNQKPNIAYITQTFPALTQTFIYREVEELQALGFKIVTCSIWKPDVSQLSTESQYFVADTHYVFPINWPAFISAHFQIFFQFPTRYISTLFFVISRRNQSMRTRLRTLFHFLEAVYLGPVMTRNRIDHIHAHFTINAATLALVLSRILEISYSFTAHNIFYTDRLLLKEKVETAEFISSISNYSKEYLQRIVKVDGVADKIHIVRCGLSPEDFTRNAGEIHDGPTRLLFVAQLEERKGAPYLIEACKLLAEREVLYTCDLIGGGKQIEQLQKLIDEYGLANNVNILGAQPQEVLQEHLREADIFVLPCIVASNGDMDGIPVSLMEAMAMEIPVISTRVSGIPELIIDEQSGILVDQKNANELGEAIMRLIDDPVLRKKIAVGGRERVVEEFNIHKTASVLGELFVQYHRS